MTIEDAYRRAAGKIRSHHRDQLGCCKSVRLLDDHEAQ